MVLSTPASFASASSIMHRAVVENVTAPLQLFAAGHLEIKSSRKTKSWNVPMPGLNFSYLLVRNSPYLLFVTT
jgi:hypothetical protein